jgi:hypothetical protein
MTSPQSHLGLPVIILSLLFGYGSLQAQPFIVGDTASPTITYVNIEDTVIVDFDIDSDNINDILFYYDWWSISPANNGWSYNVGKSDAQLPFQIQFVCIGSSSNADTLKPGSLIDNTLNWNTSINDVCLYYYDKWWLPYPGTVYTHGICNRDNTYIGFRKINSGDTLYGWFFFDLYDNFKLRSYAVNKVIHFGLTNNSPERYNLIIYPNPFIKATTFGYELQKPAKVTLQIFNNIGQQLTIIESDIQAPGMHSLMWNSERQPPGIYFYRLTVDKQNIVGKLVRE